MWQHLRQYPVEREELGRASRRGVGEAYTLNPPAIAVGFISLITSILAYNAIRYLAH